MVYFESKGVMHSGYAGGKEVTPKFSRNLSCRECGGNIGVVVVE